MSSGNFKFDQINMKHLFQCCNGYMGRPRPARGQTLAATGVCVGHQECSFDFYMSRPMLWWIKGLSEDHKCSYLWKLNTAEDTIWVGMLQGQAEDKLASWLATWVVGEKADY